MHELSLAQSIVDVVRQHVPASDERAVRVVRVRVGELSGVLADALEFCFGSVVAGTPLAAAALAIERVPAVCLCRTCGERMPGASLRAACARCGGADLTLAAGHDLQVVDVEIDETELVTP